jgi:hypothetical protein
MPSLTSIELLAAIPLVSPGDIIAPDHHNTLRAAIAQLSNAADPAVSASVVTRSFTPTLWSSGAGDWTTRLGCSVPKGDTADGWMPLDLPNGMDIDTMTVRGVHGDSTYGYWQFALMRSQLTGGDNFPDLGRTILERTAATGPPSFVATVPLKTTGKTPTEIAEMRRVDTTKYRYALGCYLGFASKPNAVQLQLVQVTCTRGAA